MIKLSNGHELEWVVAAGALGWDGRGWPWERPLVKLGLIKPELFTITTKTLTLEPNKGCWWAVRPYRDGVWNNQGLPNKGLRWWLDKYAWWNQFTWQVGMKYKTLLSLAPRTPVEMELMVDLLRRFRIDRQANNIVGIELNVSCPNVHGLGFNTIKEILETYYNQLGMPLPIILKLNWNQVMDRDGYNREQLLKDIVSKVEAVSINSVPDEGLRGGAYSGKIAQLCNWEVAVELQKLGAKVIWPSSWSYSDIAQLKEQGAGAISFGSIHMLRPWAPTRYVERYRRENGNNRV